MKVLSADDILKVDDLQRETVNVPAWGGSVIVAEMSGQERDAWEAAVFKMRGKNTEVNRENFRASLLVRCLVDENGKRLFSDAQIKALGAKGSQAISKLFDVAMRINGISKDDQEELTKNSETPEDGEDSSSG